MDTFYNDVIVVRTIVVKIRYYAPGSPLKVTDRGGGGVKVIALSDVCSYHSDMDRKAFNGHWES